MTRVQEPRTPQELAALIREGCKLRPRQAFDTYYRDGAACAMGAAYLAAGGRPRTDMAEDWASGMELPLTHCPECHEGSHCDECRGDISVVVAVIHLNDVHGWYRERIADWLEALT